MLFFESAVFSSSSLKMLFHVHVPKSTVYCVTCSECHVDSPTLKCRRAGASTFTYENTHSAI